MVTVKKSCFGIVVGAKRNLIYFYEVDSVLLLIITDDQFNKCSKV